VALAPEDMVIDTVPPAKAQEPPTPASAGDGAIPRATNATIAVTTRCRRHALHIAI
jgi:hypothetical protein